MPNASSNQQLSAITEISQVEELRDLYRSDWPRHAVGYYCLDNFLRWLKQHNTLADFKNLHIYTTPHWQRHGLILIVDRYQLFVQCLRSDVQEILIGALAELDWTVGLKVSSLAECHRTAVLEVMRTNKLKLEYDSLTLMYYMPRDEACELEINVPAKFSVRPLSVCDAEIIDALWPNRHRGSLFLVRRLIAWNANMGVYVSDTGELAAWCLRLQGGFLGALQVKESYKRLGLGSLVVRAIARHIGEAYGDDIMALVGPDNAPSRGMFDKIGFKVTGKCYWIRSYPTNEEFAWPDRE